MDQLNGVYLAIVVENVDPENSGRVRVQMPQWGAPGEASQDAWARIATLMAGTNRGTWFIPDVKDEVLIAFEGGDPRRPYVIGALWSRSRPPPQTMSAGNNRKVLRSRNGVTITLDDQAGQESIAIMDGNGNVVELRSTGITVNASSKVTLNASVVELSAAMLNVNAGMSKFNGVVQCDSLISTSVVSQSYTPGAGNLL